MFLQKAQTPVMVDKKEEKTQGDNLYVIKQNYQRHSTRQFVLHLN